MQTNPSADPMAFRTEKKYVLYARQALLAEAVLKAYCLPDPAFARASVHSVYYDTLDLQYLAEKIDSTYLKAKVRLRWYGDWDFRPDPGPAFLEAKIKEGWKQQKIRVQVEYDGRTLSALPLNTPEISGLPSRLAELGVGLPLALRPAFTISYRRMRFVDPMTGTRLALDQAIHVSKINLPCLGSEKRTLPMVVIETKGSLDTLPAYLAPLVAMGLKPEAFSKYLSCYQMLMQQHP